MWNVNIGITRCSQQCVHVQAVCKRLRTVYTHTSLRIAVQELLPDNSRHPVQYIYSTAHGQLNTRVRQTRGGRPWPMTRGGHARAIVTYAVYTLLPGLVCAAVRGRCCGYCELVQRRSVVKRNCNVAKTASLCIVFIHACSARVLSCP